MIKKSLILTLLYILALTVWTPGAAASDYDLSLSPPLLRVHIKPGKSITQVFKIQNNSKTDKTLVARLVPFTESDDRGNPILDPKATATWLEYFGLANSNIKFNEPFTITAGSQEQLVLSLAVPENAPLKDLYASLLVSTYDNTSPNQSLMGSVVSATIGSNMLITISSVAYPDTVLKIDRFQPQEGTLIKIGNIYFADSITPLTFTAVVRNEGAFLAETKGVFRVTSGRGMPIYLDGILPVNVIGKSQRQIFNTEGKPFQYSPSLAQIGPHQITLEIKTDNSNTSNSINIFFFPLKLSLGLILVLLIIVLTVKVTSIPEHKSY